MVEQADNAVKEGDFAKAEKLYWEHLVLFPADMEIKIKYADTLLKAAPLPTATGRSSPDLQRGPDADPGRDDVRPKAR